jgi:hypothetical protein
MVRDEILVKLVDAFWEFQFIARDVGLQKKGDIEAVKKHLASARVLMHNPERIELIIDTYFEYWNEGHPSKWKFATDNLIMLSNGSIGLIDNANVGLRNFGYDLGWLIWPRWVEMDTDQYEDIDGHMRYLDGFLLKVNDAKPNRVTVEDLDRKFWLMILQRVVGALFDVINNTRHLKEWNLGAEGDAQRTKMHVHFLNRLLDEVVNRIQQ